MPNENRWRTELGDELYSELFAAGRYFLFPKLYLQFLSYGEAILLSLLLNTSNTVKAITRNNGWFYCHMGKIMKEMNRGHDTQTNLIKSLEKKGLLEVKFRSVPKRRFLRIKMRRLLVLLANADPTSNNRQDGQEALGED